MPSGSGNSSDSPVDSSQSPGASPGEGATPQRETDRVQRPVRVSIPMVTFRHENWVGEAIESLLMQDEPNWEIILGDDASDDRTVEVAQGYLERCMWQGRQRLRILPHDKKVRPRPNFRRVLEACTGQYVAQLDGDDFYTSGRALSARADFLDQNQDFAAVFCAWNETDENGTPTEERRMPTGKTRYTLEEFGPYNPCTSSTVMFRRGLFGEFPDWWMKAPVGDWPLHVLNLQYGDMGYIDEVFAIHRNHRDGVWTQKNELQKLQTCLRLQAHFARDLPKKTAKEIRRRTMIFNWQRAEDWERKGEYSFALAAALWCAKNQPWGSKARRAWMMAFRIWRKQAAAGDKVQSG